MTSDSKSILNQISSSKEAIEQCLFRVETIEKKLRSRELSDLKRDAFEKELDTLRQQLNEYQEVLTSLHKKNQKSFVVAAIIMLALVSIYVVFFR